MRRFIGQRIVYMKKRVRQEDMRLIYACNSVKEEDVVVYKVSADERYMKKEGEKVSEV